MANIMSLKSLRNKPSRNGFDLSFKRNFTAKVGELLPVMCKEVLPGDVFSIDLKAMTRTTPLNTAAFARIREYFDFYFVPYEQLWSRSNTVLTQMYDNVQHATSIDPTKHRSLTGDLPHTDISSIANYLFAVDGLSSGGSLNYFGYNRSILSAKLLQYLNYGDLRLFVDTEFVEAPVHNFAVNIFPLLAYQKIYSDYFRNSQWERSQPNTFNVDYLTGSDTMKLDLTSENFMKYYNMFDLRYCDWQKDMFHGILPSPQYGDTAAVPVVNQTVPDFTPGTGTSANSISILALRQAEFLQRWKEVAASGSKDYKEQVEKHWGVSVSDAYSELCTYLGGMSTSIDINEVINTNITADNSADIAGKGISVSNGQIRFESQGRYGLIMCIYHGVPMIDYTTAFVDPFNVKTRAEDIAIPELDKIGMQAIPMELLDNSNGTTQQDQNATGYVPRYYDYKTSIDTSVGAFKDTLSHWIVGYNSQMYLDAIMRSDSQNLTDNVPVTRLDIEYPFFKVNPNVMDSIFSVNANSEVSTDNLLVSSFFDVKAVRNLDVNGLPY